MNCASTHLAMCMMTGLCLGHDLLGQDVLYSAEGDKQSDAFGASVDTAGDVDGDGVEDFIVGAHKFGGASTNKDGRGDFAVAVQNYGTNPKVIVFAGKDASRIKEIIQPSTWLGFAAEAMAGVGDVNRDGFPDLAVGAYRANSSAGLVGVFSGKDWSLIYTFKGSAADDRFGSAVAGLGDINADGHVDIIVGATQWISSTSHGKGYARVFSGKTGKVLFMIRGDAKSDHFGGDVNCAGDVNRDGIPDFIVGAQQPLPLAGGYARVFSGKTGSVLHTFKGVPVTSGTGSRMGTAVCTAGDVDADGHGDVIVTSSNYRARGLLAIGRVDVFSGRTGENLYSVQGIRQGDGIGSDVAFTGDINNDGKPDFLVGSSADYNSRTSKVRSGSARIYNNLTLSEALSFGTGCQSTTTPITVSAVTPPRIGERFHLAVASIPTTPTGGVILLGGSNSNWGTIRLPFDLAFMGMPKCSLLVSWDVEIPFFVTSGTTFDWKVTIPYEPLLLGSRLFGQVWLLDAKANSARVAVTHGLALKLGG